MRRSMLPGGRKPALGYLLLPLLALSLQAAAPVAAETSARAFGRRFPAALGLAGAEARQLSQRIVEARQRYLATLEQLAVAGADADAEQVTTKVRVAIGRFAHDSGIYPALDAHFAAIAGR